MLTLVKMEDSSIITRDDALYRFYCFNAVLFVVDSLVKPFSKTEYFCQKWF